MTSLYPRGLRPVQWVSTAWLEEHLYDARLTILDAQPSIHDYVQEHIPGAVYMSEGLLHASLNGIPTHFLPPQAVQPILRRLGLQPAVPAVVYTGVGPIKKGGDGLEQSAMAYALARFGHDPVLVLDGGIDKWKAEARPLTKLFPRVQESDWTAEVRRDFCVEHAELKAMVERDDVLLVDSRPADVYAGQAHWKKPGHIPGAINVPWTALLDTANPRLLRPDAEIQAVLDRQGVTPDRTIVCYCGTGRKAASQFLILRCCLGWPKVRLYEGSFTEWSADPEAPTVVGNQPR